MRAVAVSVLGGAGALALGFEQAGCNIVGSVDHDRFSIAALPQAPTTFRRVGAVRSEAAQRPARTAASPNDECARRMALSQRRPDIPARTLTLHRLSA
jgi:hypothetical protein